MADNGKVIHKIDNTDREFGESPIYFHAYDAEKLHMLFTERDIVRARKRATKKVMMINQVVIDNQPWWKVWA